MSKVDPVESSLGGRTTADNPKRLFQFIIESGRQLEVASAKCREVQDLFSPELLAKRLRYKEMCEKLICESLKTHGPIVREKLWRYAYYEPYNRARQLKRDKPWTPYQVAFIQNHLLTGIGQFSILLWKLQDTPEFLETPIEFRSDGLDTIICGPTKSTESNTGEEVHSSPKWLIELVHICLINIGDLYRYLTDIFGKVEPDGDEKIHYFNGAVDFYTKAFLVHPDAGLSHNQLGNLYSNLNGGIHAVYYLLYSIASANSYEGAFPNLRQLLDRKIMRFVTQPASVEPTPMDNFNFSFFSVVFHFLCEDSHLKNFEKSCQDALTNFNERLVSCDPDLDEKFLFHVSVISIMTVWRLQALNSPNISPAVAFALTVFLQLTTQLGVILEQHSHLKKESSRVPTPIKALEDEMQELNIENCNTDNEGNIEKVPEEIPVVKRKKRKKNVAAERRRRRRLPKSLNGKLFSTIPSDFEDDSSDDEDEGVDESGCSDDDSENESEYWSESETSSADSTENEQLNENDRAFDSGSSNGQSDISGGSQKTAEVDALKLAQDDPSEMELLNAPGFDDDQQKGKFVVDAEDLIKCWSQIEPLLVAISPFMRWLETSPMVKDAFAANCERVFLEKLCSTLNLLNSHDWSQLLEDVTIKEKLKKDWISMENRDGSLVFNMELPEDRSLIGLPNFKEHVSQLQQNSGLSNTDMFLSRIGRFLSFGYWMTDTDSFSVIYTTEEKFYVPPPHILQRHLREAKLRKLNKGEAQPEVIERLTKAYQNKETHKVKGRRGRGRDGNRDTDHKKRRNNMRKDYVETLAPEKGITFVVVDLAAVLHQFNVLKRLACHPKFIVAVPQSVRKTVDDMKETDGEFANEARTSGRWLENAFYKSHPGLLSLKEGDKIPLNFPYPDDGDDETREYFELFEHCNFLVKTEGNRQGKKSEYFGDVRDKYSVFFLSGDGDFLKKPDRSFCPIQIARAVGYWVDLIALYPASGKKGRTKKHFKSNG